MDGGSNLRTKAAFSNFPGVVDGYIITRLRQSEGQYLAKINQSKCSIAGPIFSKYWTGHFPESSRTCVFAVFAFFSRVINLLLTKLARDRTGRITALEFFFCTDLAALGPYCQDLGRYSPREYNTSTYLP